MNTRLTMLSVFAAHAGVANAQWTVTNLHPAGASTSFAYATDGTHQVGQTSQRACMWRGTAESRVNLHPPGAFGSSVAYGVRGSQQVGTGSYDQACVWNGDAGSFMELVSTPMQSPSLARATNGTQQVGYTQVNYVPHATLWSGTTASRVDLHPLTPLCRYSIAYGIGGDQQVGFGQFANPRAILWTGSADSWVDLNPPGAWESTAYATNGFQQVGYASIDNVVRASLWSGSASSWVDLNPVGSTESYAHTVCGPYQAGVVRMNGGWRLASLWRGTADSWVNLHAFLPADFSYSEAAGVWSDGATLSVVGFGYSVTNHRQEALLWTLPLPCPADVDNDGDFANGFTRDGAVTIEDLLSFLVGFEAGNVLVDLDNGTSTGTPDNAVDINDLLFFLARFEAGC